MPKGKEKNEKWHIVWMKFTDLSLGRYPQIMHNIFDDEEQMLEYLIGNAQLTGRSDLRRVVIRGGEAVTDDIENRSHERLRELQAKRKSKKEELVNV